MITYSFFIKLLQLVFVSVVSFKLDDPIMSQTTASIAGVILVSITNAAAFGMCAVFGVPFNASSTQVTKNFNSFTYSYVHYYANELIERTCTRLFADFTLFGFGHRRHQFVRFNERIRARFAANQRTFARTSKYYIYIRYEYYIYEYVRCNCTRKRDKSVAHIAAVIVSQEQTGVVLQKGGLGLLLTSFSDCVAFAAAVVVPIPALRVFAIQAAFLVIFNLVTALLVFPTIISLDLRRRK